MDELDPIRELVVQALAELEQALVDGLPARAPSAKGQEIKVGWAALRARIESATRKVEHAEVRLSEIS